MKSSVLDGDVAETRMRFCCTRAPISHVTQSPPSSSVFLRGDPINYPYEILRTGERESAANVAREIEILTVQYLSL